MEAGANCHGHKLLEKQLASVRHLHLDNPSGGAAACAFELVLFEVGHRDNAASFADVHPICIALVEEALLQIRQ